MSKEVNELIKLAVDSKNSLEAMHYTQAALNAANALAQVENTNNLKPKDK